MCALGSLAVLAACSASALADPAGGAGSVAGPAAGSGAGAVAGPGSAPLAPPVDPPVLAGIGAAFCDGSDDLRLGMWTPWQFYDSFSAPFGGEFAFVDGACNYVASIHPDAGIVTGVLDAAHVVELARDVGYARIAEFSGHLDAICFEGAYSVIRDGSNEFGCGCECDEGTPEDLVAAELASRRWIARLAAEGTAPTGPVRAMAVKDSNPPYIDARPWPLERPITDILEDQDTRGWDDAGAVIDDVEDAAALRALRPTEMALGSAIYVVEGGQQYTLSLRDELPAATDAAIRAFESASHL
jgi:hypothetical protein